MCSLALLVSLVLDTPDTHEGSFLSGLVPVIDPGEGADAGRILPVNLALFLSVVSALLQADEPFVVAVPAVKGLVLGQKSWIAGRGANVLDLVQKVLLLLVELGDFVAENLRGHINYNNDNKGMRVTPE